MLHAAFEPGHETFHEPVDLAHERATKIGTIVVTPALRRISCGDRSIILEPKVMQVLVALMRVPGTILSRDDLHDLCWSGHIVGEASLNRVISLLRSALRDISEGSVAIDTVPRVGYRLLLTEPRDFARASSPPVATAMTAARPHRGWGLFALMLALLFLRASALTSGEQGQQRPVYTIAVLPLAADKTADPFLARGLADEIRKSLARADGVRILGTRSAERLVGAGVSRREMGRRLGVSAFLAGRMQLDGDAVRLSVRLEDAATGRPLWSSRYKVRMDDVLDLPDRLTADLQARMGIAILRHGRPLAGADANQAVYLVAQGMLRTRDNEQITAATALLRTVTAANPGFADGWAGLAKALYLCDGIKEGANSAVGLAEAREAVRRALVLDPNSPEALAVAGLSAPNPELAVRYLSKAVGMNPASAEAWLWLANAQAVLGQAGRAQFSFDRVLAIDPLWSRAQAASEFPAATGQVALADRNDRAIFDAAADGWQKHFAQARIARRHGDWSQFLRLAKTAAATAPAGDRAIIFQSTQIARGYLGLPVAFATTRRDWMVAARLLNGNLPSANELKQANLPSDFLFSSPVAAAVAPGLFIRSGRVREYLAYYDAQFSSPEALLGGRFDLLQGEAALLHAPFLAIAMRRVGRDAEAVRVLALAERVYRTYPPIQGDVMYNRARLAAVEGRREDAVRFIEQARRTGWPDTAILTMPPVVGRVSEDPAFNAVRNDARFRAIAEAIESARRRERDESASFAVL